MEVLVVVIVKPMDRFTALLIYNYHLTATADGDLESVVECPVCLVIPRSLPIPCCPAGHIMCRPCR